MLARNLLIAAVVVGVIVDGFFAIINFYPIAPSAGRSSTRYVVMQLDDVQAKWFEQNILADFNEEANADVKLIHVDDEAQLLPATAKATAEGKHVVLVALPATQLAHAVREKRVKPFSEVVSTSQINKDFQGVGNVLGPGKVGDTQYFLPQMRVVDVLVYRVSKVRDAVQHWAELRPQIDAALKAINGRGLPLDYELNLSPDQWDSYDMFVMAYYWSHRRYNGQPARPRVAHRSGDAIDGQVDLAAMLYEMGVDDKTFAKPDSPRAVDAFQWEALYRAEGLYPDAMFATTPFSDDHVLAALRSGEIFLAPIDAMDAFTIHGGGHEDAHAQVDDAGDVDFTELPSGASLELDAKGHSARTSGSFSFVQDWQWAVPAGAKGADVGYRFVQFLWRPDIHARQCEALGMLPMHASVVKNRASLFRVEWMSHIFEAGLEQAILHARPIPPALVGDGLGSVYAQLWTRIIGGRVSPRADAIVAALHGPPPVPKPLVLEAPLPEPPAIAAGTGSGSALPASDDLGADRASAEDNDWEIDAVFDAGSASAVGSGSGAVK